MTGVKRIILFMGVLFIMALSQSAAAQNVTYLEELQTKMQEEQASLMESLQTFDKSGANVTYEQLTDGGKTYNVTIYKDKDGNILRELRDSDGNLYREVLISSGNGPILTVTYSEEGDVAKRETFEPVGLRKYTEIYDKDGSKEQIMQDASQKENNTLTTKVDKNGDIISKEISTTPGLPDGCTFCRNTGQYECEKKA
jgi:hypothetical protein